MLLFMTKSCFTMKVLKKSSIEGGQYHSPMSFLQQANTAAALHFPLAPLGTQSRASLLCRIKHSPLWSEKSFLSQLARYPVFLYVFSSHVVQINGTASWLSAQWGSILVKRSNEWRIRLRLTNHYSLSAGIKLHLCKWNMMWCISPLSPSQGRICSTCFQWPNSAFRLNSSRGEKKPMNSGSTCICGESHDNSMYNIQPFPWLNSPTLWPRPAGYVQLLLHFCRRPGSQQQFHTNTTVRISENTPSSDHL